jgi:hypothetical protein
MSTINDNSQTGYDMTATPSQMINPLDSVVKKIAGGRYAELARMLEVSRSTVSCWRSTDRRRPEMIGVIPQRYHAKIIDLAREMGRELTAEDLIAR